MEAYRTDDAACRAGVLAFMSAWTARLHDLGYHSGFYSSMGSGGADQVANYAAPGYVRPDYLNFARWDGAATLADVAIPDAYWSPHRRMKQYAGGHQETWGGVTINIDNDYVDFGLAAGPQAGRLQPQRLAGRAGPDVEQRQPGRLPGQRHLRRRRARRTISGGWKSMNAIVRIGDLNRDGYDDVVARATKTGYLYFYPGRSNGTLGARKLLSKSFKGMREITAIGDLTGDGYPDLVAAQTSNKNLYLYPGKKGSTLGARKLILKGGWNTMTELAGVADFDRAGYPDLVARQTATGKLFLYPGRKGAFGPRRQIGTGFTGVRDLVGVGDFDRDGFVDLAGVLKANGNLMLYPGAGTGLRPAVRVGTGFGCCSPLL